MTDLLEVLDEPDRPAGADLDLLARMRTPGALELLSAYERMTPDLRSSLVVLLRAMTPAAGGARQTTSSAAF